MTRMVFVNGNDTLKQFLIMSPVNGEFYCYTLPAMSQLDAGEADDSTRFNIERQINAEAILMYAEPLPFLSTVVALGEDRMLRLR
ncbi:hypothetical protein [Rhodoblastus sp.]|uniref:hypothetical protein n=1 Tax=Rhodoblastus sp. TaxID=1962975 RepID=UPI003F96F597